MAARKLNVLVYTGTGTTTESAGHCLFTLRRLLYPNYAVVPIGESALLKEPWASTCALLVMPGGADLGYCRVLNGAGNKIIAQYVRSGGRYMGFCAGGYYGSARCEFERGNKSLEVIGSRELAFFPGTCRGGAFEGFEYHSEKGARATKLAVNRDAFQPCMKIPPWTHCYYNGGGVFVDLAPGAESRVEILASYDEDLDVDGGSKSAAIVYCTVGSGAAMLTGPHPEFEPARLAPQPDIPSYAGLVDTLRGETEPRTDFLKACLTKLGLEVSGDNSPVPSLTPLYLGGHYPDEIQELLHSWDEIISKDGNSKFIRSEADVFQVLEPRDMVNGVESAVGQLTLDDATNGDKAIDDSDAVKQIVVYESEWPDSVPSFDYKDFYAQLQHYRHRHCPAAEDWGNLLMYGKVVTSTNSMLDKNPKLLSKLPTGFTLTASTQVAGRGRGSNVWVSPPGQLVFSTVINHPHRFTTSRPIVFIQYLAAVAVVEAIHTYDVGYGDIPVKLKWPNDIYARDPSKPNVPSSYVKIGGILSNCAFSGGNYQVVLGIGINAANERPTTSLGALLPPGRAPFKIERLLARILTQLEALYKRFLREGFSRELEQRYYKHWLHTDQVVTLEAEAGARARVMGITTDWGMLKVLELGPGDRPTGRVWKLQSDENSFDFWKGLVKTKL